jgi:UDP-N-acetylglucosamine--N-acetylmuramyl-(pentapeptide) pyrophosphoryl-undecaprenol N-acetylglucosamine transferase
MRAAYACADLALSRSGAGTVFEILALKKPSILVPLEGQTRGDQVENAKYFQEKKVCRVLRQADLVSLLGEIEEALVDEKLKHSLATFSYPLGNENILHEVRQAVKR